MSELIDEILATDREHRLGVHLLASSDRESLRERIAARYSPQSAPMWEAVQDCTSAQSSEGWQWIHEFVGSRSCVLLFDVGEEVEMLHVPSGIMLHRLLQNTFGFEFYVSDSDATYLIGFNHHDMLVCCGAAQEWIKKRSPVVRVVE